MFTKKAILTSSILLLSLLTAVVPLTAGCTTSSTNVDNPAQSETAISASPDQSEAVISARQYVAQYMAGDVQIIFPVDYQIFLRIDGVPGDSLAHPGYIEILSFDWGISNSVAPALIHSGGGSGRAEALELSLSHMMDIASPYLMFRCAQGYNLMYAYLELWTVEEVPQKFYELRTDNVAISRVGLSSSNEIDEQPLPGPVEEFGLYFGRVQWTYWPQEADGSMGSPISAVFDIEANKVYWNN